jgi:hypothetical protein
LVETGFDSIKILYWLIFFKIILNKKGTDQTTIATLFNIKTQGDISRYLSHTRIALIKYFVRYNLGPDTQSRQMWLKNNIAIAKELLECTDEQLILVVDGNYSLKN